MRVQPFQLADNDHSVFIDVIIQSLHIFKEIFMKPGIILRFIAIKSRFFIGQYCIHAQDKSGLIGGKVNNVFECTPFFGIPPCL